MKADHAILQLRENLQVSPSGYHAWAQRLSAPGPRALEDQALATEVVAIHQQSRQPTAVRALWRCSAPGAVGMIVAALPACCSTRACAAASSATASQPPTATTDHPIAPNRLAEAPKATAPNQLWVADVTYIPTQADMMGELFFIHVCGFPFRTRASMPMK